MHDHLKLSRYHVVTPPLADQARGGRLRRVLFAARTARSLVIDEAVWQAVRGAQPADLSPPTLDALVRAEVLVPADEDERATILDANDEAVRNDRCLYLVVQPSAWCQLGCSYCGQAHTRQQLGQENQERLVERVRRTLAGGRYDTLEVCWFGGEPLTGMKPMRALTGRFREIAARYDCVYKAKMVTNGLALTPAVAAEVVRELAVERIEITLDGMAEYHDTRRHTKSGGPSFALIFRNVVALAKRDDLQVALTLRCNVDQHNRQGVTPLMQRLVEAGIHTRIASFYVAPVFNWGNDAGDRNVSREEFAQWETEWLVQMYRLGFPLAVIPERETGGCIALRDDAELVDPYGTLFKCSETPLVPAFADPAPASPPRVPATLGCAGGCASNRYAVGNLAEGVDRQRCTFQHFNDLLRQERYPCHACNLLPVCGGYCPKKWADGVVPCPTFKYNIEQRLLLAYAIGRIDDCSPSE